MEERATKTDAIIKALENGTKIEYRLKELTGATHDDFSFVEEQGFVQLRREGFDGATIIYQLSPKGREVYNANGLLNYLEQIKAEQIKAADKSQLEERVKTLQANELEYKEKIRVREDEMEALKAENLILSSKHLTNQNKIHPLTITLKILELLKWFGIVAGCFTAGVIAQYKASIADTLIAILKR